MSKSFTDQLRLLRGGVFAAECTDKFAELVKTVNATGKAGKLTITLDVKRTNGMIAVLPKVTDKAPEETQEADVFWPLDDGSLSLENPRQRSLDLKPAEPPKTQIVNG